MSLSSNIARALLALPFTTALAQDGAPSARICLAPTSAQLVTGNTETAIAAVRRRSPAISTGPTLGVRQLSSRLASQAREEAKQASCPYVLLTTIKHRRKQDNRLLRRATSGAVEAGAWASEAIAAVVTKGARMIRALPRVTGTPGSPALLTAQESKGVHVCVGTDNVIRYTSADKCPGGQRLYRLAEVEDEVGIAKEKDEPASAVVADLKSKIDFLTKRVANLEAAVGKGSDPGPVRQVKAPFEVVDAAGNPIFVVSDAQPCGGDPKGSHRGRAHR